MQLLNNFNFLLDNLDFYLSKSYALHFKKQGTYRKYVSIQFEIASTP